MFDTIFHQLKTRKPCAPLFPSEVRAPEISQQITEASDAQLFGEAASNDEQREMRLACRAGLLLLNDDLEASHAISQKIDNSTGAFWHAIMHRRERDFSNSRHWWRRVGTHPAFDDVYTEAMSTLLAEDEREAGIFAEHLVEAGTWKPEEFVEICERTTGQDEVPAWIRRLQRAEMTALLRWCRERA